MHHLKFITFIGLITALLVAIYNLRHGCYGCGGMAQLISGLIIFSLTVVLSALILRILIKVKKRRYLVSFLIILSSYIAFEVIGETLKNKRVQEQWVETNHFKSLIDRAWSTGNDLESSMAIVVEAKVFSENSSASYILKEKIKAEESALYFSYALNNEDAYKKYVELIESSEHPEGVFCKAAETLFKHRDIKLEEEILILFDLINKYGDCVPSNKRDEYKFFSLFNKNYINAAKLSLPFTYGKTINESDVEHINRFLADTKNKSAKKIILDEVENLYKENKN